MSGLHEECGVFGVYSPVRTSLAGTVYYGLYALQHRGQESCGMVICDDGLFYSHKDLGLVNDVFTPEILSSLLMATWPWDMSDMAQPAEQTELTASRSK